MQYVVEIGTRLYGPFRTSEDARRWVIGAFPADTVWQIVTVHGVV